MAGSLPALKPLFVSLLSGTKSLISHYPSLNSQNHTTNKSGFVRHENVVSQQDVKLEDWTEAIRGSPMINKPVARSPHRQQHTRNDSSKSLSVAERPYTVCVTGAKRQQTPREDDEWETIDIPTNQSKERLHNPSEIHKNVEIFSTSQRAA